MPIRKKQGTLRTAISTVVGVGGMAVMLGVQPV
jgi:hypothetical protein